MPLRDILLTAIIFGLLPACLTRPWVGILVWYWFGIMNPHRLTFRFAHDFSFAMLIGGATLAGLIFTKDRKPVPWNMPLVLMVVLTVYFTFTTFFAWAPPNAWAQLSKVAKIVLMTIVATMLIYNKTRIRALMLVVAFSIGFYGVKGALFVLRSGGAERVQGPEGSFIEGNTFLGLAMNMVLPLLIYLARTEEQKWLKRVLYVTAGMTVVSIIFTYSRGAFLGLAAVLPLIFWNARRKWLTLVLALPVAAGVFAVLPDKVFQRAETIQTYEEDGSANQRLQSWTVAWNIARDRPLTGAGFEFEYADNARWLAYGDEKYSWALKHSSAAHSIYFQILGQHGFVAFALFLMLLASTLVALQRIRNRARGDRATEWLANYARALQIGLIGYMVSGAFLSSAYFDLAWLYFAMTAILARELSAVPVAGVRSRAAGGALAATTSIGKAVQSR